MIQVKPATQPTGTVAGFLRETGTGGVTSLDSKLFAWQRLRGEHDAARVRLKDAMGSEASGPAIEALHAEVQRLQQDMDTLLREIDAMRRARAGQQDPPRSG